MAILAVGAGQTYTTIQAAINAANNDDIIVVRPGIYQEDLTINKSVTLIGPYGTFEGIDGFENRLGVKPLDPDINAALGVGGLPTANEDFRRYQDDNGTIDNAFGNTQEAWIKGTITVTEDNVTIDGFRLRNENGPLKWNDTPDNFKLLNNYLTGYTANNSPSFGDASINNPTGVVTGWQIAGNYIGGLLGGGGTGGSIYLAGLQDSNIDDNTFWRPRAAHLYLASLTNVTIEDNKFYHGLHTGGANFDGFGEFFSGSGYGYGGYGDGYGGYGDGFFGRNYWLELKGDNDQVLIKNNEGEYNSGGIQLFGETDSPFAFDNITIEGNTFPDNNFINAYSEAPSNGKSGLIPAVMATARLSGPSGSNLVIRDNDITMDLAQVKFITDHKSSLEVRGNFNGVRVEGNTLTPKNINGGVDIITGLSLYGSLPGETLIRGNQLLGQDGDPLEASYYGIDLIPTFADYGTYTGDLTVEDNTINSWQVGVNLRNTNEITGDININGNTFENNAYGVVLDATATTNSINIAGNTFSNNFSNVFDGIDPVITMDQVLSYEENQDLGSVLGTVSATDNLPNTDNVGVTQYFISSGNDDGFFTINSSGEITLTEAGLAAANDFETSPSSFNLGIIVTDGGGLQDTETITLSIINVNEGLGQLPPITTEGAGFTVGATLIAAIPFDDPDGIPTDISYQWQRLIEGVWTNIPDATEQNYIATEDDNNNQLRVEVTYIAGGFEKVIYSNNVSISLVPVSGTFDSITGDNNLDISEKEAGVTLTGTVSETGTTVTILFGGQTRVAQVDGLSWSYVLKPNDYNFFAAGSNLFTAIFTRTDGGETGSFTTFQTLTIPDGILPPNTSNAFDPTQPKGLKSEVIDAAQTLEIDGVSILEISQTVGILGEGESFNDPNIAVLPIGTRDIFDQGANAGAANYAAVKTEPGTSIQSIYIVPVVEEEGVKKLQVVLADGTVVEAEIPPDLISPIGDPLAITISGVQLGGTTTFVLYLSQNVINQLPEDLDLARYVKFNYESQQFELYDDFNYDYIFNDVDGDGVRDFGEVYLTVNLTDGDIWDGDGLANGIIVDPGQLGIATDSGTDNNPPIAIELRGIVAENDPGAFIGSLTVTDDPGDSHTFTVNDSRFEVINVDGNNILKLREGESLDYEAASNIVLTITAIDNGGLEITQDFTITVTDVNEAPVAIELNQITVIENDPGAIIGTLTVSDPDGNDGHTLKVNNDTRFEIVDFDGNQTLKLKAGESLDYEAGSVELSITATDNGGLEVTQDLTVSITDVNEPPVVSFSFFVPESTTLVSNLTVEDPENDPITLSLAGVDASLFSISPTGELTFNTAPDFEEPLNADKNNLYKLQVVARDEQNNKSIQDISILVTNVNEAPIAIDDVLAIIPGSSFGTLNPLDNDSDPDLNDPLTIINKTDGNYGRVEIRDNELIYTLLDATYIGDDVFSYTIIDEQGLAVTANVNVTITGTDIITYPVEILDPEDSLIPDEAGSLSDIVNDISFNFLTDYDKVQAKLALQEALSKTEASFTNLFGLYEVDNALTGSVNGVLPEDKSAYAKAALSRVVPNFVVRAGGSGDGVNGDVIVSEGKIYAPFVIAHGGNFSGSVQDAVNAFFQVNPDNSPATAQNYTTLPVAYFSFGSANPDGAAHIKSFGNNVFGFEDLPAGVGVSDYDFNDTVFSFG
ncbi:cadherin domain-containing protein [Cylindrospermopsis raciborskii Cr2010]|uniref:cadherin domain-containing protein n=1 Tax=Cylindrospermopsis raciborskii TaxID=77022 RepID=UPI001C69DCAE|nr:cadherin domain-containing protein [Cylindrospermopsis raciborskii]UJL32416.1 cadherin domain-containing protein [Cylindrospermopsis raciborskii Cr2010]